MLSMIFCMAKMASWIQDFFKNMKYGSRSPETTASVGDSPPPSPTLETTQASISSPESSGQGDGVLSLSLAFPSNISQPRTEPLLPIERSSPFLYNTYLPNGFPRLPFAAPWSPSWPNGNLLPSLAPAFVNNPWEHPLFSSASLGTRSPYSLQTSPPSDTCEPPSPPSPDSSSQETVTSNNESSDSDSSDSAASETSNKPLVEIVKAAVENYAKHLELLACASSTATKARKRPHNSEPGNNDKANRLSKPLKRSNNKKFRGFGNRSSSLWSVIEEPCVDEIDSEIEDTWHRDMTQYNQQTRQRITGEISNETIMENISTHGLPQSDVPLLPLTISKPASLFVRALATQNGRRQRGEKRPIPETLKDARYFERRKRNNLAAKKSRDNRKLREDHIAIRACLLEKENAVLRAQVAALREEASNLRHLILQKKPQLLQTLKVLQDNCKPPEN